MLNSFKNQRLQTPFAILTLLTVVAAGLSPELFYDRIFPFDSILFVANGAFFLSLIFYNLYKTQLIGCLNITINTQH
jgi:hypothetical protein